MPDSKQLVILKRMTTHLEGITPTNDYAFDLTGKVFRGRTKFGDDEVLPFIAILESLRPDQQPIPAGAGGYRRTDDWEILVQGWLDENRAFPTDDLYNLKASVEKRLQEVNTEGSPVYLFGGLIIKMRIGPGVVIAATPQVGGAEAFYLPLLVTYAINLADPFA
jgi:hypothetical protein